MILKTRATSQPPVLAFVILWLTGLYLRLPILVIPPLTAAIDDDFNLPQALLGSLTTLPILMLSVGAILGSLVIIHLGARTTLAMALALVGLASAARGLTDQLALLLSFSAFMGLGIAIMQPALPALLTRWLQPTQLALGSAVYMNGMLMGEFIGAGLTLPILMPWLNNSWQLTLLVWSLPALLVVALLFLPKQHPLPATNNKANKSWMPNWSDPLLWRMGFLLAVSASFFFGGNAYLSSFLEARGESHLLQATFFWFNIAQMFASILMLFMARRWIARILPIKISLIATIAGMLGMLLFNGWLSLMFGFMLSFWAGILLILLVALPPQLRSGQEAGKLAAGAFTVSYSLSFFLPLAGGLVADWFEQASLSLWFLLVLSLPAIPLAWGFPLQNKR